DLDGDAAVAAVERVAADTAANRSSMCEDVENGRRTEVDAIYGAIESRAERHDIDALTCRTLGSLLRAWEASRDVRRE
ncbi:2-dehydropantoate 2-reductase, partial [Halorubrum sp. CBA1125]|uniref:ketopantoate reductase family protein n=1 Tax=Halorubrum sp. CBA1125 TaxID=2668072 RepID=UPI00135D5D15